MPFRGFRFKPLLSVAGAARRLMAGLTDADARVAAGFARPTDFAAGGADFSDGGGGRLRAQRGLGFTRRGGG